MKVYKPGTDCEVDFSIFANGSACQEYVLPSTDDEPTAGICFIPVPEDANITVHGTFSGSVLYGRVDVLADGAFVADRVIEDSGSKEGILKYWDNRKVEIKTFLHVPDLNDHKPRLRPKVVEGGLVTKRLSNEEIASRLHGGDDSTGIGVGSITLVVSLNQDVFDTYGTEGDPAYPSVSLGSWRKSIFDVSDSGIQPELEMKMDVFPDSNPVKDKRATHFWRDTKAARFGSEPWAYLVFYYRTQAAIDAAGCVPLSQVKELPADGGLFIRASEQEVVTTRKVDKLKSSSPAPIPAPAPEAKRSMGLGQALFLPGSQFAKERSLPRTFSSETEKDSLFGSADESVLTRHNDTKVGGNVNSDHASAMKGSLLSSKSDDATSTLQPAAPQVSFSDPLTIGPTNDLGMVGGTVYDSHGSGYHVNDLASPSLPGFQSQSPSSRRAMPTASAPIKPSDPIKPAAMPQPSTHKRPASQLDSHIFPFPTEPATASPSPAPAKRLRSEEKEQRLAQVRAQLQAKKERKATMQKKLEDDKLAQQEQQQRWVEEDAKRREEEARRRAAEEEAEAEARKADEEFMAEMQALVRENEQEDEEVARVAEEGEKQRREWEEIVRARGQGGEG